MITSPAITLMNRLKCSRKMLAISGVFLIPILLTLTFLVIEQRRVIRFSEQERLGIEYLIPLIKLVQHLPEHRGMTNTYLSGNSALKPRILEKRRQIALDLQTIDDVDHRLGDHLGISADWREIKASWEELQIKAFTDEADSVFQRHTALIARLLSLIKDISDSSHLTLDPHLDTHYIAATIVNFLPNAVEYLGQARGMASGLAARKHINRDDQIRLSVLLTNVQKSIDEMNRAIQVMEQANPKLAATLSNQTKSSILRAENYLDFLRQHILGSDVIEEDASEVFSKGTEVINSNLEILGMLIPRLDQMLAERIQGLYKRMIGLGGFSLLLSILALYLFSGFYWSFIHAIAKLNDGAKALAQGRLGNRIHLDNQDEFSELAHSFNHMADQFANIITHLEALIGQLTNSATQMSNTCATSCQGVEQQRAEIHKVTSAINQMAATVQEIAQNAQKTAESTKNAHDKIQLASRASEETAEVVQSLSKEIGMASTVIGNLATDGEKIGNILDVIREIAEQTNLLALNAAIEAARAGEQGRGFAVVAEEVRTLASRTQDATQEIQGMIQRIQAGTFQAVQVMEEGQRISQETVARKDEETEFLTTIVDTMVQIDEMAMQIADATEQQSCVAEGIRRSIENIYQETSQTLKGTDCISESSRKLASLSTEIQENIHHFSTA